MNPTGLSVPHTIAENAIGAFTVRICGIVYSHCERVQDEGHWGIKTPQKTFWLFPVCDEHGRKVQSLPPFLPNEIRPVTIVPPDLTGQYPETVRKIFNIRRKYFTKTIKYKKYLADNPNLRETPTRQQFAKERKRILAESLTEFTRDRDLQLMVWHEHGTTEIAIQYGYLGDVMETEVLPGKTPRRISKQMSIAVSLAFELEHQQKIDWKRAWQILKGLKYVMIYLGVPDRRFIYLSEIKEASQPKLTPEPAVKVAATKINLAWPHIPELAEIKKISQETHANVSELVNKTKKRTRKWHQAGGKATSKWHGREKEAADLARVMRQARDRFIRDKKTKHGALLWAYSSGRAWWKSKNGFKGGILEGFLEENKISNANLYRLMQRDFRKKP